MIAHRRPLRAAALAVALLAVTACSDEAAAPGSTTAAPPTTVAPTSAPTTAVPTTDTTAAPPTTGGPASSIPPVTTEPGAPASAVACATLADTLAIQELVPREGPSWPDERMRVVVDARRDAALYAKAADELPATEAPHARALAAYASWVASEVQTAESAAQARAAVDAYPDQAALGAADAELERWRGVNCP